MQISTRRQTMWLTAGLSKQHIPDRQFLIPPCPSEQGMLQWDQETTETGWTQACAHNTENAI